MTRGVRLYLVGSLVLVALAGCGRGFLTAEREPWRAEAEKACLKSGTVKETAELVRADPILGPGVCGAEFPLKVAALGEGGSSLGFANDLRPPGSIGNQPRWQVGPQPHSASQSYPQSQPYPAASASNAAPQAGRPMQLNAPGLAPPDDEDAEVVSDRSSPAMSRAPQSRAPYNAQSVMPPRLGPSRGSPVNGFGSVAIKPAATLACPMVSALDRWLEESVQPSAMRWLASPVAEIRQISAYSCRSRNGDGTSKISEHAFGNALDIAAFVLADGRRISVKDGWRGLPEEQQFLREIQGAACGRFTTVLAPGSNAAHHDHFHVDLRRRSSGRDICMPQALSGDEIASLGRGRYAAPRDRDPNSTRASTRELPSSKKSAVSVSAHDHDDDDLDD